MLEDPVVSGVIIRARPMSGQQFLDRALEALVASSPLDDVLEFLIASLDHELTHARAVMVYDWDGERYHTKFAGGFPGVMVGGVDADSSEPWQKAMANDEVTVYPELDQLPAEVGAVAAEHGQAALWIAPVMVGTTGRPPACIGIWRDIPGDPWVSHQVLAGPRRAADSSRVRTTSRRGAPHARGDARHAHRHRQPRPVLRPSRCGAPCRTSTRRWARGGALPRPRRLQDRERHLRPQGRRRRVADRHRSHAARRARRRSGRAASVATSSPCSARTCRASARPPAWPIG